MGRTALAAVCDATHERFDATELRQLAGDRVFARGLAYYRNGQVELVVLEPGRVVAKVSGTEIYRCELTDGLLEMESTCSCRAFEDGFCKHLVATALAANEHDAGAVADDKMGSIRRHLVTKEPSALVELILRLARQDEALYRELDMEAAMALEDDAALLARFSAAVDAAMCVDHYIGYREARDWARKIEAVLTRIAGLVDNGRAAVALAVADHALTSIESATGSLDDSDGHLGGLLHKAKDIHLAACLAVRPDPVGLAADLLERELDGQYEAFDGAAELYAEVLGEAGLAEYRRLASEAWDKLPPIVGSRRSTDEFSSLRSQLQDVLDFFAERDGDADTRIAIRARDLSSPYRYLELAQLCLSLGREEEALARAEEGLWVFEDGRPDERLIEFTVDLLLRAGREADAQTRLWQAFEREPSLGLYQRLRKLCGEPARDRAIAFLQARVAKPRTVPHYYWEAPADLLIRVLMAEKMHGEAWDAVHRHGASISRKEELAKATQGTHPSEALGVYAERVEQLVSGGGNHNYEEACGLVGRMAALRPASEQAAYVAGLKVRHKAKRNFMKLLQVQ